MPPRARNNPLLTSPSANLSPDQDALRWRQMRDWMQGVERQLAQCVKYGAFTQVPGGAEIVSQTLRAAKILGPQAPPGQGTMTADFTTDLITVTDGSGTTRAQMGNLAANGVSPAQFGFRANDATGTPIFDSLGLINVMSTLVNVITSSFATSSTTAVTVTGSSKSFTLSRQQRLLFFWGGSCSYGPPNTNTAFLDLVLDGTDLSSGPSSPAMQLQFPQTTSGAVTSLGVYSANVASGSHTVNLAAFQNGTQTMTLLFTVLLVFQLGS